MVRSSMTGASTIPTTTRPAEPPVVPRIAGGFVLVNVASLLVAWRACRARPLGIGDFRAWLACHELKGRRCKVHEDRDRSPTFGHAELAKLLGASEKRAKASVKRLAGAGLVEWSAGAIGFPDQFRHSPEMIPDEPLDSIGRGRGSVAIPRRMLRYLAHGARPALIATILGALLRCLSRRKAGFDGRGRFKASWIARTFGVSLPAVKLARRELVKLGWIEPEASSQWAENRWGRAYRIDLDWIAPSPEVVRLKPTVTPASGVSRDMTPDHPNGSQSIPPRSDPGPISIPPDSDPEPLREIHNQEPGRGPTGFSIEDRGKEAQPPAGPLRAPKLDDVQAEDLADTGRLLDLHRQAVARGLITTSEADRLRFVGAARHALAVGKGNPPGLFAYLIRGSCWRYITQDDEDQARRLLHRHDHGGPSGVDLLGIRAIPPGWHPPAKPVEPGLSEDARIVKAIREASIRAGFYRDPWPAFVMRYPAWTRARWDAALVALGLA